MVRNEARRTALADAAIEVLARDGARGLTFRAVDTEAGVPAGTASNYFANRDDLLRQAGLHIHVRLAPDPAALERVMAAPRTRELVFRLMHDLRARMLADRAGYLALLELRLEATRRPALRTALTETLRQNLAFNIDFHTDAGLPGGADTVLLLYFAMTGLLVEHLTTPDVLTGHDIHRLVDMVVASALPD
ncbi:TetR family transcriptional regulator [Prauserella sp. PE36]|uniref:TetR family transcriptional regulator n=1 Tax=Prauserella endophytica TaxID=1592324 RepID=A0ABY2S308_9PSEU|nr:MULTISPECIES: TetR family transcriptional regulator [Prauserella]PXY29954.1 TetR family transcriptional regulator [Prauserella coralliicola]RBM11523.1 TetR family transcriptional regulator [Prauserella sp. PE36]TKG69749.1 TetR family transcriptional regulator [Prauserella endophytica]